MSSPRTWLITGAGRGLGRALTLAALDAGDTVVATVRDTHELPEHPALDVRRLDVREAEAVDALVADVVHLHGRIDVLVNNAGYGLIGAIEEVGEQEARDIIETDLLAPLRLSRAALPAMRAQGSGHILQISSTGGVGAMPLLGLYNAAKWGLEGFSEALAGEVAGHGIRVTIVEPGALDTAWGTSSMRFASPDPAYDDLREQMFGSRVVPWQAAEGATGGGTSPAEAATAILAHVDAPEGPLRLLVGDDAPGQVAAVLEQRRADYARDPRCDAGTTAERG